MALVRAGGESFDVDLVVFDKDGTMVDFDRLWTGKLRRAVELVVREAGLDTPAADRLLRLIGVDPATRKVVPESPLAVTTLPKLGVVCTVGLHQEGFAWHAAEVVSQGVFMPAIEAPPAAGDLATFGDLPCLFAALAGAGARIAILTSDDRLGTEACLPLLGLSAHVAAMVCGDDPLPSKPSPEGFLHLARQLGVAPSRALMVGDSVADMKAGRNAGAAGCVAVLSGTGDPAALAAVADVVLPDIGAITVG